MPADTQAVSLDAVALFDIGLGPYMLPVTPPDGKPSPSSKLNPRVMGKAPGRFTQSGWTGVDVNDLKYRCHDYNTARLWIEWGANIGLVAGNGLVIIDNDQGEEFSNILQEIFSSIGIVPLRRFVAHEKHKRDAFILRVLNFIGDPAPVLNKDYKFRKGTVEMKLQVLAQSKSLVISGTHPGTKAPYVLDRKITSFEDIPIVAENKFYDCVRNFMEVLKAKGWTVPSVPQAPISSGPTAVPGKPNLIIPPTPTQGALPDPSVIKSMLDGAQDLLRQIPNRDTLPGELRTKVDEWLDDYPNWVQVCYSLAAQLGKPIANTSEAEQLWLNWSDGRQQVRQSSLDLWRSAISQPQFQFGDIALLKLVRSLVPSDTSFPPIDPNHPAIAKVYATRTPTPVRDELMKEWVVLADGNRSFVNTKNNLELSYMAFAQHNINLGVPLARELGLKPNKRTKTPYNVAEIFDRQPDRINISGFTYSPGGEKLIPTGKSEHGKPLYTLNRWIEPEIAKRVVSSQEIKPWLDHLDFIMGTESDRFLRWCAYNVQYPQEKPNWHFLVMGCPGLGKDTLVAPLKAAVGERNHIEMEVHLLTGTFTDAYEKKLLVISETAQPKSDARHFWNRLKQVLARPPESLNVNIKYMRPYEVPNRIAVVMFSNDLNPIFLEPGDRRVHVINRRQIVKKPDAYYTSLWSWLNADGIGLVASYLYSYPLSDIEKQEIYSGAAPDTPAKQALIQQNLVPALSTLLDLVNDARAGVAPFDACLATVSQLVDQIGIRLGNRHRPTPQDVSAWLLDLEMKGDGVGRLRKDARNPNHCGIVASKGQTSQRIWHLSSKAPDGRAWNTFSNLELLAMWQGKKMPSRATVIPFPSQEGEDEPI